MYEIVGNSLKYFKKDKNGDNFYFGEIKSEKIVIAIVADGVSKQPCDWLASDLFCSKFVEFFNQEVTSDLKDRIYKTIVTVNQLIVSTEGQCKNMRTTLSLLIWKYDTNDCYISNVGDSRIYKCENGKVEQITIDDAIKSSKTILNQAGKRMFETSSLTNTIGSASLKIKIEKIDFKKGTTLILATDGFYDAKKISYLTDMLELSKAQKLDLAFNKIFSKYDWSAKDDMTAVVIRNNDANNTTKI